MVINGNLTFHTLGNGELRNAIMERFTTTGRPAAGTAGRLIFDTDLAVYLYDNGTSWVTFASGAGDAAAVQAEVDAIETASGGIFAADGTYNGAILDALSNVSGSTDLANALSQMNTAIDTAIGIDTLAELTDVTVTGVATGEVLLYTGAGWENQTFDEAGINHETHILAKKATAGTIAKGQAVKAVGHDGTFTLVELADADAVVPAVGIANSAITSTAEGEVTVSGVVAGLDTSSFAAGSSVFLDITPGALTATAPTSEAAGIQKLGLVIESNLTTGKILVVGAGRVNDVPNLDLNNIFLGNASNQAVTIAHTMANISDVVISGVTDNEIMAYDSVSGDWINQTAAELGLSEITHTHTLDDLTTVTDSSTGAGEVLYTTAANTWVSGAIGATSGVQAQDDVLDDLAGLAVVATDQMIYGTGAGIFGYTTVTTAARGLLDDIDEATMRTTLGLVAGGAGDIWVEKAGDTMTGNLVMSNSAEINMGSAKITNLADGTLSTDAVNKGQLDAAQAGLLVKDQCRVATTTYLDAVGNGTWTKAGTKDTHVLTSGSGTTLTIDGVALANGDRVLVKDESTASANLTALDNGIYVVGGIGGTVTLSRATDYDGNPAGEVKTGTFTFINEGSAYAKTGWALLDDPDYVSGVCDVDVAANEIVFTQFQGLPQYTAGTGLVLVGGTDFNVNLGAGIKESPLDEVGIDLYDATTGALILTENGSSRSTASASTLYLLLNGSTLAQSASGLNVAAAGITETELNVSVAGDGLVGGGGLPLSVSVDNSSIEIVSDTLQVKAGGITNAMLANNSMTVSDGAVTTFDLALGDTLIVNGGQSITIDTSVADTVTIDAVVATSSVLGVASFSDAAFTVTAGDVTFNQSAVSFTLNGDTGSEIVAGGDTMTVAGGTGIDTVVTATDTVTVNLNATVGDLTDVTALNDTAGEVMVDAGAGGGLVPRAVQYVYSSSGVAATTHTVNHALNQKYVNVTVLDASDNVIIPESISFTDANNVTVTFNTAIHCRVVVMGITGVAATDVVLT